MRYIRVVVQCIRCNDNGIWDLYGNWVLSPNCVNHGKCPTVPNLLPNEDNWQFEWSFLVILAMTMTISSNSVLLVHVSSAGQYPERIIFRYPLGPALNGCSLIKGWIFTQPPPQNSNDSSQTGPTWRDKPTRQFHLVTARTMAYLTLNSISIQWSLVEIT